MATKPGDRGVWLRTLVSHVRSGDSGARLLAPPREPDGRRGRDRRDSGGVEPPAMLLHRSRRGTYVPGSRPAHAAARDAAARDISALESDVNQRTPLEYGGGLVATPPSVRSPRRRSGEYLDKETKTLYGARSSKYV